LPYHQDGSLKGTRSFLFLFDIPGPNFYTVAMAKKKRLFTKFFVGSLFLLGFTILFLELGSRWYQEPEQDFPAPERAVCDLDRYPLDEGKTLVIQELVGKKARGEKITREDLDRALISAPQDQMPYLNGVVCNQMIFVSSRLPESARYYVARHELEHVFQQQGMDNDCQDWELCATWAAAWEFPLGLLRTITSSLREAYRISPSLWSFLFSSWRVFKLTLLP